MKKFYYSLFAAATMLLATTSCSQEEDFAQQSSNEVTTFSVSLDGETGSRAVGDGTKVNKLYCEVYDQTTQTLILEKDATRANNGGWTLELPLMKSETYDILFWAQMDGNTYYDASDLRNIKVTYDNVSSNIENRDAFFNALDDFTASGSKHTIVLRRPFAQLNIATTLKDWNDAMSTYNTTNGTTGVKPVTASSVKVSSLATNFNVLTGAATATTPAAVEFKANDLIDETISIKLANATKPTDYKLLAMNYLLPVVTKAPNGLKDYNASTLDTDKDVVEVEFTLYKGEGEQIVNVKVPSTPVQRNYRTNIIGDLLTGEHFDIIVDADFDKEENQEITISAEGIVKDAEGIYHITKPEGLWALANLVNNGSQSATPAARAAAAGYSFKGETFVLDCNVDLEGKEWIPMDGFAGTFDGNEMTIFNFKVNKAESAGLFGNLGTGATIKNLTVTNATIHSNHWAGVIAGNGMCLKIENCKVENSSVTVDPTIKDAKGEYNGDKAGAIIGYIAEKEAHITDCEAKNVTIQAYRDLGGIVGYANGTTISGNKVEKIVLTIDNSNNYKEYTTQVAHDANAIVGEAATNSTVADDNTAPEGTVTVIYTTAEEYPGYYEDADGNYCVTENKGIETVLKNDEFWADKTEVSVILKSDLTVDITAWDGDTNPQVFGNDKTETITIDLQGKTLTFNQLGSDWNNIAANNAKLIIKNGHITNSGYNNGPWNRHDLNFACEVELIDITTDKAIALKNAGTLTRVSISDANTSDTYALWIQPKGQTVTLDGCTIDMIDCTDGRGIKIDEQYVDAPALVTLNVSNTTFKTEEKAAILVKSVAGANITLSNIDITDVQADKVCAVWVDEASVASFDLVNVTGGKKALEGAGYYVDENGKYYATSSNGLAAIISKGIEDITLSNGTYALPTSLSGMTVVLEGLEKENTIIDMTHGGTPQYGAESITFKNLTMKRKAEWIGGFSHSTAEHYEDCIIEGTLVTYAPTVTAKRTNFVPAATEYYNVHIYSPGTIKFEECNFSTTRGRSIYAHHDGNASAYDITIDKCNFTTGAMTADDTQNQAAIRLHTEAGINGKLTINGCTATGWKTTHNGGLWVEWNNGTKAYTYLFEKNIDGMTIDKSGNVVLKTAAHLFWFANQVNVAGNNFNGKTVKLDADIDLNNQTWTPIGQTGATEFKGIFDGQNHTIKNLIVDSSAQTGEHYSSGLFGWAESGVTIKNVKVDGATVTGNHNVAVIVGYTYSGKISNCHVSNANIVCNHANDDACGDKCGLIAGYAADESRISDCSAIDGTVKAGRDAGQLIGCGYNVSVSNCTATNVVVSATGECTGANVNNAIIGRVIK